MTVCWMWRTDNDIIRNICVVVWARVAWAWDGKRRWSRESTDTAGGPMHCAVGGRVPPWYGHTSTTQWACLSQDETRTLLATSKSTPTTQHFHIVLSSFNLVNSVIVYNFVPDGSRTGTNLKEGGGTSPALWPVSCLLFFPACLFVSVAKICGTLYGIKSGMIVSSHCFSTCIHEITLWVSRGIAAVHCVNTAELRYCWSLYCGCQVRFAALKVIEEMSRKLGDSYKVVLPETIVALTELNEGAVSLIYYCYYFIIIIIIIIIIVVVVIITDREG